MSRTRLGVALGAALLAAGARAQLQDASIPSTLETVSPAQLGMRATIAEREAAGLPAPKSVQFTYEVREGAPPAADGAQLRALSAAEAERTVTVVSRSVVLFETPEQAGYAYEWPRLAFHDTVLPGAPPGLLDGDYTEAYRTYADQIAPGIWDKVQFGREPRTLTVVETLTITFPEGSTAASALVQALRAEPLASAATVEQILMGFTYEGPHIDNTVEKKVEFTICLPWPFDDVCWTIPIFEFKAGFEVSFAFGLRLPAEASLTGPVELVSSTAPAAPAFYTDLSGRDWSPDEYAVAGVDVHAGHEFVFDAYFFAGVKFLLFGQDPCMAVLHVPCFVELGVDDVSTSFPTPFGTGASFPIPYADVPIYKVGIENTLSFEVGLRLTPLLGSSMITADAVVSGAASGGGPIRYAEPGVAVPIAVAACIRDGARDASVQVQNFRYWFTDFGVDLAAYGSATVMGFTYSQARSIYTVDLSRIFPDALSVGGHVTCDALFRCSRAGPDNVLALAATVVDRDPPVTTLAVAGTEGKESWYRSDLLLTLAATDAPAGCDSGVSAIGYTVAGVPATYSAPFVVGTEGITPFSYGASDRDGVVEPAHDTALKIDKTAPVIGGAAAPAANAYGWNAQPVTVHFTVGDALSGIDPATTPADVLLSAEGANQGASGSVQDLAGNASTAAVTGIDVDLTPPSLVVSSPQPITYPNTTSFALRWSTDAAISGVAREAGAVDGASRLNGEPVALLLFFPGPHAASVEVMDRAEHVVDDTVTFQVSVDLPGLLAALRGACENDWINKYGICMSLEAKVLAGLSSIARADLVSVNGQLGAFLNELDAQWDKAVNPQAYELLRADALYVLAHL